jgi:hypothetical protein
MADQAKDSKEIDKEIGQIAEKMAKSVVDGKQALFDTIINLGPEGLKKTLPTLSPAQQEIVKSAIAEMSKATHLPEVTQDAGVLTPEKTQTKHAKMKAESQTGSDNQDEKLMQDKNKDIKHQGGPSDKPEGWEGQVIKAKEPPHKGPHGGVIIGHTKDGKPIYEHAGAEEHKDFTPGQHQDASDAHVRISDKHWEAKQNSPYASVAGLQSMGGDKKKFDEAKTQHAKDSGEHELHRESAAFHRRMADHKAGIKIGDMTPDDHKAQADRHLDRVNKLTEMRKCGYMAKDMGQGGAGGIGLACSMDKSLDIAEDILKSLFCSPIKMYASDKDVPEMTKQQCLNDIEWKLRQIKDMKDMAWMIQDEVPEAKEMMEKKFSKLKSEIKELCEKHSHLKKAYENSQMIASETPKSDLQKKQGVPEGVDPEKWERGVREVKEQGHSKTSAIKIINSTIKKGENMEQKPEMTEEQKLEKKKMKKAKKIAKSIQKIVKLAKALGLSKDDVKKAIEAANGDLKVVKSEMKDKVKGKINKEENQVEIKTQDEAAVTAPKPDQSKGALEVKPDETADEALKQLPKVAKSINWQMKSSIAAGSLGRNTHWDVDGYIEKSEQEKQEIIKKGGYFGEKEVEALKKSETAKADLNDLIEKGMDYSKEEIARIEGVRDHKPDAGALKKSNYDVEIARSMGMTQEQYEEIFGKNGEE